LFFILTDVPRRPFLRSLSLFNTRQQSNDLLRHLPTASFVAIDEEMTGISCSSPAGGGGGGYRPPPRDQCPAERYPFLKQAPERYSIIQLGVALFHRTAPSSSNATSSVAAAAASSSSVNRGRGYATVTASPPAAAASATTGNGGGGGFTVRKYNFYVFPSSEEREVVLNPGAVAFLHRNNMSFDLWTRSGIPFATTELAVREVNAYIRKERDLASNNNNSKNSSSGTNDDGSGSNGVTLRRNEDIDFFARAMASLREWLDAPILSDNDDDDDDGNAAEGVSFLLPVCNSFLRRALYEAVGREYPALVLENGGNSQIRVWRLTDEERHAREDRLRREAWEDLIGQRLGVYRVFDALRRACCGLPIRRGSVMFADSYESIDWTRVAEERIDDSAVLPPCDAPLGAARGGAGAPVVPVAGRRFQIPLVVHNGFMDLCFLLTHFHSKALPERYQDCKDLIAQHFPIVYDTKLMATECNWGGPEDMHHSQQTNLSNLFQYFLVQEPLTEGQRPLMEQIREVVGNVGAVPDQEHEAGFDAYMTGVSFLALCDRIRRVNDNASRNFLQVIADRGCTEARDLYLRNMLYQMSMYTMDLEETRPDWDPMSQGMNVQTTYRVSGIDPSTNTNDIVRALSGRTDEDGRGIRFEIVWIDNTTFLVAASCRDVNAGTTADQVDDLLRRHGQVIFQALRDRFPSESIVILENYLRWRDAEVEEESLPEPSVLQRVLAVLGLTTVKRAREIEALPPNKKRRVN
jgi:CAF1 family ribonuclease